MEKKGKITSLDVRNYIEGNLNYLKRNARFMKLQSHIQEQAICRAAECIECLEAGACTECGCATPQMFYSPKKKDAKDKWGEMLNVKEWREYKKEHNLQVPNLDLANIEIKNEYSDLSTMPPWDLKALLIDLSKQINEDNET